MIFLFRMGDILVYGGTNADSLNCQKNLMNS